MVPPTALNQVQAQVLALRGLVDGLVPDAVPLDDVYEMWEAFDVVERLGSAGKTLLASRVDECEEWKHQGHPSAAHQMAALAGSSVRAAQSRLTTARRLEDLPAVSAAVRSGAISEPQARVVADAAAVNPDAEVKLVDLAGRASLAELSEECARAKASGDPDPDATYERILRNRRLRQFRDPEGGWNLSARGPVDAGMCFNLALEEIIEDLFQQARSEGQKVTREQLAFDALILMAQGSIDADVAPGSPAEHPTDPPRTAPDESAHTAGAPGWAPPEDRRHRRREGTRAKARDLSGRLVGLIRVDHAALVRGWTEHDECCEVAGLGPIPVERARELLGDATLKLILTKGVAVANVTHLGRRPTAAQRAALLWTQPTCAVEGCTRSIVQLDHRSDWSTTYTTHLDQLDRLCAHHHSLKTHEGWALVPGTGKRPMVPPDDPRHPDNLLPPPRPGSPRRRQRRHPRRERRTTTTTTDPADHRQREPASAP